MYDLIIFDLDGTLIDSIGDIADALGRTLGRSFSDREVAGWVGSGVRVLLERAGAGDDLDSLADRFRAEYAAQPVRHTRPYLRVAETLRTIAGLGIERAVATNKPGQLARTIIDQLGLSESLPLVLGEDDVGARKPSPLIVDIIRGTVGTPRARTLYVGDSLVDAACAQAAGVDLCLVTYGYADPDAIRAAPAKFHLDRFEALAPLLTVR